jgi:hypothetical protein
MILLVGLDFVLVTDEQTSGFAELCVFLLHATHKALFNKLINNKNSSAGSKRPGPCKWGMCRVRCTGAPEVEGPFWSPQTCT